MGRSLRGEWSAAFYLVIYFPFSDLSQITDWNPVTKEQALTADHFTVYVAEKKFGEQAVLEFADSHPHMDITLCMSTCLTVSSSDFDLSTTQ